MWRAKARAYASIRRGNTNEVTPRFVPSFAIVAHLADRTVKPFTDEKLISENWRSSGTGLTGNVRKRLHTALHSYRCCSLAAMACSGRKADKTGVGYGEDRPSPHDPRTRSCRGYPRVSGPGSVTANELGLVSRNSYSALYGIPVCR